MISELKTFLIAMTPIGELRASIPIALSLYQLPVWSTFFFSVLGNLVPPVLILGGLKTVADYLSKKFHFFNRFFSWLFRKTYNNHFNKVKKWQEWALLIFVAIPLPFTGAWTGSLIAFVFNFSYKRSLVIIAFGVLIAGMIVTLLTFGGIFLEGYFGWQSLLGILIVVGFLRHFFKKLDF